MAPQIANAMIGWAMPGIQMGNPFGLLNAIAGHFGYGVGNLASMAHMANPALSGIGGPGGGTQGMAGIGGPTRTMLTPPMPTPGIPQGPNPTRQPTGTNGLKGINIGMGMRPIDHSLSWDPGSSMVLGPGNFLDMPSYQYYRFGTYAPAGPQYGSMVSPHNMPSTGIPMRLLSSKFSRAERSPRRV
jgi:hypothetical protein